MGGVCELVWPEVGRKLHRAPDDDIPDVVRMRNDGHVVIGPLLVSVTVR
jgi:hypothetical protein